MWMSVLARGPLEAVSKDSLDSAVVQATQSLQIPYFQVFDEGGEGLEFEIVRIDVTELTRIVSGPVS